MTGFRLIIGTSTVKSWWFWVKLRCISYPSANSNTDLWGGPLFLRWNLTVLEISDFLRWCFPRSETLPFSPLLWVTPTLVNSPYTYQFLLHVSARSNPGPSNSKKFGGRWDLHYINASIHLFRAESCVSPSLKFCQACLLHASNLFLLSVPFLVSLAFPFPRF